MTPTERGLVRTAKYWLMFLSSPAAVEGFDIFDRHGHRLLELVAQARAGGGNLLPVDGVGIPEGVQLLLGQIADDPDGQAGTGEGLAHDQVFRQAQLAA